MRVETTSSIKKRKCTKKHTRSRFGCQRCKGLKVKCDELKPSCTLCAKSQEKCDYSIKLTWGGRPYKNQKSENLAIGTINGFEQKYSKDLVDGEGTINTEQPPESSQCIAMTLPVSMEQEVKPTNVPLTGNPISFSGQAFVNSTQETYLVRQDIPPNNQNARTFSEERYFPPFYSGFDTQLISALRRFEDLNPNSQKLQENIHLHDITSTTQIVPQEIMDYDSFGELRFKENFQYFDSQPSLATTFTLHGFVSDFGIRPTGLEFIPEILNPFPDLLLNNPLYRENYHSYIEVFSKALCPAPPRTYTENPFTCLLPKMSFAAGTEGILAILIAFGFCLSTSYRQQPFPKDIINELLKISLNDLYNRLTDHKEATSDCTLALLLALSTFENLCYKTDRWRAHLFGAKKLMVSRGLLKGVRTPEGPMPSNGIVPMELVKGREGDLKFFFTRWFAYMDVIGALSASSSITADPRWAGQFHWLTFNPSVLQDRQMLQDIDPFMGFDLELLGHFSTIIKLVKEREGSQVSTAYLSVSLIQQAIEAKEELLTYITDSENERDLVESRIRSNPANTLNDSLTDYRVLRSTNLVFGLSGILQIYRRLLLLPRESVLVQKIVTRITECLAQHIDKEQPAAHATIFSLFSTGCEILDEPTREFYMDRVQTLANKGWLCARAAKEIMNESWQTGKYWADIVADRKVDLVFL